MSVVSINQVIEGRAYINTTLERDTSDDSFRNATTSHP